MLLSSHLTIPLVFDTTFGSSPEMRFIDESFPPGDLPSVVVLCNINTVSRFVLNTFVSSSSTTYGTRSENSGRFRTGSVSASRLVTMIACSNK
jgi:hypothetical protein